MEKHKKALKLNIRTVQTIRSWLGQLCCITLPLALFFIGACLAVKRNGYGITPFGTVCTLLFTVVFIVSFGCWLSLCCAVKAPSQFFKDKANHPLIVLLVISFVLRLPQIGSTPFQDFAVYYGALKEMCAAFQLTPAYMIDAMRLAAHPSYVYTLVAAIPEFFMPGNVNNMWLMQTVFSLIVIAGVYGIMRTTVGLKPQGAFIGGLMFSCCPIFLGMDNYFQLDFGSGVFFFMFICAFLNKKMLLMVVLAGGLVLTKEFGIVLLAGFIIGALLYYLICTKGGFTARIMAILRDKRMVTLLVIGLVGGLVMIYYLFFSSKAWIDISSVLGHAGDTRLGYIGFNPEYIVYKFVQLLVMNFDWLLLIMLAIGIVMGAVNKRRLPPAAAMMFYGCTAAAVLYFIFSCAMVTYTVMRYNIVLCMILVLLATVMFVYNFKQSISTAACGAVAAVLAVQGYLTIDPVMKAVYPPVQTGTVNMVYTNFVGDHFIGDYAICNNQYSFITKALTKILAEQSYDGSVDIVFVGTGNDIAFGTQDRYGWDPVKQEITFIEPDSIPFHIYSTSYGGEYIEAEMGAVTKSNVIFIVIPESRTADEVFAELSQLPYITEHYTGFEAHSASGGIGGTLYYWTAQRI